MATRMKPADVVLVGMGWTGSILAKELAAAGLKVVGLERGRDRQTVPDFQSPAMHDELRYSAYNGLMQDVARETITFRNSADQEALPMRRIGAFRPGTDLGGAGVHWSGVCYRYTASDFKLRSHYTQKYGARILDDDLTAQDWPVSYQELEPHYDRFEYLAGVCGTGGNVNGRKQAGGNPFEEPRSRDFPNPPMKVAHASALFSKAASDLGLHPFVQPSANMSRAYTNPEGMSLNPCTYCGFCSGYGCEHFAKSSPQACILPVAMRNPNFELRTGANVVRINLSADRKRATSVTYVDGGGQEIEQPAEMVFLCAWALNNVRLMLLSDIGKPYDPRSGDGAVGRNFSYQTMSTVDLFYDESVKINPFMGAGALAVTVDDFNGDNFDHSKLGFVGGAYLCVQVVGGAPIGYHPVPQGTPTWGVGWKHAVKRYYNHNLQILCSGSSMAWRGSYWSLDPTYKDANGLPLLRLTHDFNDNDLRMSNYVTDRAVEIAKAMRPESIEVARRTRPFSIIPYQTTHVCGGTATGDDPRTSVVNRYLQSWDVPNLFVMGSSVFPQNSGYNPTVTIGAMTYWALDAIKGQYLKSPGRPMVTL